MHITRHVDALTRTPLPRVSCRDVWYYVRNAIGIHDNVHYQTQSTVRRHPRPATAETRAARRESVSVHAPRRRNTANAQWSAWVVGGWARVLPCGRTGALAAGG
eukprot:1523239-Prymnesium_polylepis.2